MNARIGITIVVTAILAVAGTYMFLGGRASAAPQGPTDVVRGQNHEVNDTFRCSDGDPTEQVREWHFTGVDRSRRNQSTIDWFRNMNGHRVSRIRYTTTGFPNDGKKYMRIVRFSERERRREGFDYSGSDANRWAEMVEHNIIFEPQLTTPVCGPAR